MTLSLGKNVRVFLCAALPPPIQGHAVVSQALLHQLNDKQQINILVVNNAPGPGNKRSIRYHLPRLKSTWMAAAMIVKSRQPAMKPPQTLYLVLESGLGIIYNFVLVTVARLLSIRVVLHHHTSAHTKSFQLRFSALAALLPHNSVHVVLCPSMRDNIRTVYTVAQKILICSNAFVVPFSQSASNRIHPATICVGMLANLTEEKGTICAIRCISALLARGCRVQLILAGPICDEATREAIQRAQIEFGECFRYVGPVDECEKRRFFHSIDIFILPTIYRYEAQPLVILEALSHGRPVISNRVGYIEDMLPEKWIAATLSTDSFELLLAKMIEGYVTEENSLRSDSKQARKLFELHHSQSMEGVAALVKNIFS